MRENVGGERWYSVQVCSPPAQYFFLLIPPCPILWTGMHAKHIPTMQVAMVPLPFAWTRQTSTLCSPAQVCSPAFPFLISYSHHYNRTVRRCPGARLILWLLWLQIESSVCLLRIFGISLYLYLSHVTCHGVRAAQPLGSKTPIFRLSQSRPGTATSLFEPSTSYRLNIVSRASCLFFLLPSSHHSLSLRA